MRNRNTRSCTQLICSRYGWHLSLHSNSRGGLTFSRQTRMQVVNPTPAAIYTGIGNAISTISRAEGYMSLWRGVSSVVLGAGEHLKRKEGSRTNLTTFKDRHMLYISRHTRL
jgi:hypothetical protein